jgi:hypothetical protein
LKQLIQTEQEKDRIMERLVNFETAKLAREIGYNPLNIDKVKLAYVDTRNNEALSFNYFIVEGFDTEPKPQSCSTNSSWFEGLRSTYLLNKKSDNGYEWYLRPTQSYLQTWVRDTFKQHVFITFKPNIKKWDFIVYSLDLTGKEYVKFYFDYNKQHEGRRFDTYEDALDAGLFEALEIPPNV